MPDPVLILKAVAASGGLAALILLACAWPWKAPRAKLATAGSAVAVAAGFVVGCLVLGIKPHWPPLEDVDRWLLLLMPAAVIAELIALFFGRPKWIVWLARGVISIAAGQILLHGTTYIAEMPGAARQWSVAQTWLYLGAMTVALAAAWASLLWLAGRQSSGMIPISIALACGASAVTIMLSGYATGGQMGLPLAGALVAVTLAALLLRKPIGLDGAVGVGIVGQFALLVVGRFFGELTTLHGVLLFAAPLACWVAELPNVRMFKSWQRALVQLIVVCIPLAFVVVQAQHKFATDSKRTSASGDASADEYLNYGK